MKPETGWVTLSQHPWFVVRTIFAVERGSVEPVLGEDLREPFDVVGCGTTSHSVLVDWEGHVSLGIFWIEILAVPARGESNGGGKATQASCITLGETSREGTIRTLDGTAAPVAFPVHLVPGISR